MLEADRGRAEEPNVRLKGIFHGKWRVSRKLPWKVYKTTVCFRDLGKLNLPMVVRF
jgi:hypothetical protein